MNSDFSQSASEAVAPLHARFVSGRRTRNLARWLCQLIEDGVELTGLDVGCGTGEISRLIMDARPEVSIVGVDVLLRDNSFMPVTHFDGHRLPFDDQSFDFTILVDVLHHTHDASVILKECARVSRRFVLLKDHYCQSDFDKVTLSFMDWVGNRAYGVNLPYNYLSVSEWQDVYKACRLTPLTTVEQLDLYAPPFNLIFGRHLHFVSKLVPQERLA